MKAKILFITGLLCLGSLSVDAQKHIIKLSDQKLTEPITNILVEEIIDLRFDPTNIGWVQTGMTNAKAAADFERPFSQELKSFFEKNTTLAAEYVPVVLKVNKFVVSEKTNLEREFGIAEIDLELLAKKESGYVKIADLGAVIEESSMTDITGKHGKNIADALEQCFAQVRKMNVPARINKATTLKPEYLKVNTYYTIDPDEIPVIRSDSLVKGVYRTFQEFRNNSPGIREKLTIQKNGTIIYSVSGQKVKNAWGFSNGKTAYIFNGDNYFPLQKGNEYFQFTGLVSTTNSGAVVMGSLLGGMVGGAIAGAITSETNAVEFIVNMKTGRITAANEYGPEIDLAKTARIVLFRNAKAQASEDVGIYVNDSLYAQLKPNSYTVIQLKVPVTETEFCLKSQNSSCLKFTPVLDKTKYIECSLPNKQGATPKIEETSEKEGLYYLKIIKAVQQQQNKKS